MVSINKRWLLLAIVISISSIIMFVGGNQNINRATADSSPIIYFPVIMQPLACPSTSGNKYSGGTAFQFDRDDPVRPSHNHADKNLALRSYQPNPDSGLKRDLVDYGVNDPKPPPQLATIFSPSRVPEFGGLYQVNNWNWQPSPNPGTRGSPISGPPVTGLGMKTTPGEMIRVPTSGYDIGGGQEVIILFADQDTVALRYAREDSAGAAGYVVHIDNICTDPNLLSLYNGLDVPAGPRYVYVPPRDRPYAYQLPALSAGQMLGTARDTEIVIAVVDTGRFQDPRSCGDWWQVRPGYGPCH